MDKKALFVRPFNFCSEIMLGNFRLISRNSALYRNFLFSGKSKAKMSLHLHFAPNFGDFWVTETGRRTKLTWVSVRFSASANWCLSVPTMYCCSSNSDSRRLSCSHVNMVLFRRFFLLVAAAAQWCSLEPSLPSKTNVLIRPVCFHTSTKKEQPNWNVYLVRHKSGSHPSWRQTYDLL